MFWRDPGRVLIFEAIVPFVGYKSWINPQSFSCWVRSSMGMVKAPEPWFTSFFTLLALFRTHLHTSKTICPSIPLLGWALKNASVSISKVHSIPHSGGNFPEDVILFPLPLSLSLKHTCMQKNTHAHNLDMRACMRMFLIYLCAEQTPRCVSLVSCVMMMKGTCCSQQKPLSTLCYWHPACIIQKSSGNSVTSLRVSTFFDMGWGEMQDSQVERCPRVTFRKEKMGQ